jgi:hypothetical protein
MNIEQIFKLDRKSKEIIDGKNIDKLNLEFNLWKGERIKDTFGNKPVIYFNNKPLFAELVIVEIFKINGINAVWVDNFRKKFRIELPENNNGIELPIEIKNKFDLIVKQNKTRNGCWDIITWNDKNEITFFELKLKGRDEIRDSQIKWLNTCIEIGYSLNNFTIIEWKKIINKYKYE